MKSNLIMTRKLYLAYLSELQFFEQPYKLVRKLPQALLVILLLH